MAFEGLQDYLGSLNNLATAPDMLSQLELSEVTGSEDLFSAADKEKMLQDAGEAHESLVDTRASGVEIPYSRHHRQDIGGSCL